jgi:hypothetical protein
MFVFLFSISNCYSSTDYVEVSKIKFPKEKIIKGKLLKLNGVSIFKKLGILKVYVVGLYLEKKSNDSKEIIESEQIKYMITHYLTKKATSDKISKGFIKLITESNDENLIKEYKEQINKFKSWLDSDMGPGFFSETIYIPNSGLTLIYKEKKKGIIKGKIFAQMYYRYNLGEKADKGFKKGLLELNQE